LHKREGKTPRTPHPPPLFSALPIPRYEIDNELMIILLSLLCRPISPLQNAIIVLDNTMMSPYLQRPLEFGVDIVYDSGTKYLSGHHDLMAGVAIARTEEIGKVRKHLHNRAGRSIDARARLIISCSFDLPHLLPRLVPALF
jgi:hypothetical protein